MNYSELRSRIEHYFRSALAEGKRRRSEKGPFTQMEKARLQETIDLASMDNMDYWQLLGRDNARTDLDEFCKKIDIDVPTTPEASLMVLDEVRKVRKAICEAILSHGLSLESYDFSEPLSAPLDSPDGLRQPHLPNVPQSALQEASAPLLSALFAQRHSDAQQSGEWSQKLTDDYQKWTELFIELQGDRPITEYRKTDARDFKTALLALPTNRGKLPETRGLSALDAIEKARAHGLATLSNSTINKALGRMQATWKWAAKQLDEDVTDIFGPMKLANKNSARDQHDPFSKDQLQAIFDSPVFTGCKSTRFRAEPGTTDMSGTSWYWLPLLGLWTGARRNELCQLRVDDLDKEDGIPFMRVQEADETQRVKFGKKRIVPLHPELVRLGFLRFVEAQRDGGHERLFPDLKLGTTGYYSDQPSKDFSRMLKQIGAKTPKTSFHSFRHGFKDACRHAGVPSDINDILMGHSLQGMAGRYGDGNVPLPVLYEAISKVDHKGLSFVHVKGFAPYSTQPF